MLLCWWFRCAGDFVVLVISLCWWCLLVMFAGAFVVLVISLCWWCCCAGDFVALVLFAGDFVVISLRWWCCCAAGDFVVLVVMLLCWLVVSLWTVDQVPSLRQWAHDVWKKNVRFLIAEVWTRSPRTWIHSGSWLPSCLVIKTMSVNLSIDLCCVISVFVCKCCGLSVAMPMANSPTPLLQRNYLNHYRDTQYQPRIIIHNSGIYLVENYFLHSAPLFSFSNSRSAKSKTWLRAVALLQTWHLNAMRQRLNAMRMTYIYIYI